MFEEQHVHRTLQMKELPSEVAHIVDTMKVGEISAPFTMKNSREQEVCAIIKLKSRIDEHRCNNY